MTTQHENKSTREEEFRLHRKQVADDLIHLTAYELSNLMKSAEPDTLLVYRKGLASTLHAIETHYASVHNVDFQQAQKIVARLALKRALNDGIEHDLIQFLLAEDDADMQRYLEQLDDEGLADYFKILNNLFRKVDRGYHKQINMQIFNVSKTNLQTLMSQTQWSEVKEVLFDYYPNKRQFEFDYYRVYNLFTKTTTTKNFDATVISVKLDNNGHPQLAGLLPGKIGSYSLDFERWERWLSYYVNRRDIEALGAAAVCAHCLYHMTYLGYHQQDVRSGFAPVLDSAFRIKDSFQDNK